MTNQLHIVNVATCNGDGIYADVCPTESIQMPRLSSEDFKALPQLPFGYDDFLDFLKLRCSVRVFKDQPVEHNLVEKILESAATAPVGSSPSYDRSAGHR